MSLYDSLLEVLESKEGYDLELFGTIWVGRYENGQYGVTDENDPDETEYLFDTAKEALDKFIELREQYHLGYDYEIE